MTIAGTVKSAVVAACVLACAWVALAEGGAREPRPACPEPTSAVLTKPVMEKTGEGRQVTARLIELLGDARSHTPNLERGLALLAPHWRQMRPPYAVIDGDNKRLATSIALRTSGDEKQWAVATASGGTWTPDARTWNMSEGSFDQRESIFAPTPSSITFRVTVPTGGALEVALGTANVAGDATTFRVVVHDGATSKVVLLERALPEATRDWVERDIDLSEFAGKGIELELVTEASARNGLDPAALPRPTRDPDAGVTEAVAPSGGPTLALWGNPTITSRGATHVPYNVLFIVVDALRADAIASFHDDAEDDRKRHAKYPPLDALLPKVPGLVPNLDALAARGVRFTHAYSGGAWTRPGTLSMLSGERSSELGIDTLSWVLADAMTSRFYASSPPLLPLLLRPRGVATRAFVNNYFMVGYAPVGVDMGFERVDDHRFRTKDTALVTKSAVSWMRAHADERFFAFCNYNSPHEPWEPPVVFMPRVPPPPAGPRDAIIRLYLAEAAKDDEAIGLLLQTLDDLKIRDKTLVIVTADHGETFSIDHDGRSDLDKMRVRYHHAVSNYEETTHVPILMSLPGVLPENVAVAAQVRNVDIAPTVLEILGMDASPKMSGRSMLGLARGQTEPDERVVISEGRGTRGVLFHQHRLLLREGKAQTTHMDADKDIKKSEELYDLESDPGERHDIAKTNPELLKEMRARYEAARTNVPAADASVQVPEAGEIPRVRLRFAGGPSARRVSGKLTCGDGKTPATMTFELVNLTKDDVRSTPSELDLAFMTDPDSPVGLDVRVTPPASALRWEVTLDDAPWPKHAVYTGPFGLFDASAEIGLVDEASRNAAYALRLPEIDPRRDVGLFVTRERKAEATSAAREHTAGESDEMDRLMKAWGYAHPNRKP